MEHKRDKRFYWLKLKEDFFDEDTISFIEEQENGKDYCIFYLKLCLKSLRTNGKLIRCVGETLLPYDVKSIARATKTDFDTAGTALKLFQKLGIISVANTGEIYISQINELVGSETDKAGMMRKIRAQKSPQNGNNVTKPLPKSYQQVTESLLKSGNNVAQSIESRDKSIDNIDTSNEVSLSGKPDDANSKSYPYAEIVNHLNQKTGSNYQSTCKKTRELIRARFADGHDVDAFKRAVDNQVALWWHDFKMRPYLRPETLFSPKMDGYANANVTPEQIAVAQGKVGEPIARGMEEGTFNIKAMF